jgi:hypothetical protein
MRVAMPGSRIRFTPNPPCPVHIHRVGGRADFARAVRSSDPLGSGSRHPVKQGADQSDTRGMSWRYLLKGTPKLKGVFTPKVDCQ